MFPILNNKKTFFALKNFVEIVKLGLKYRTNPPCLFFFSSLFDSVLSSTVVFEVSPKYWLTYWKDSNV